MKIIFLDIDGVLATHQSAHYFHRQSIVGKIELDETVNRMCPISLSNLDYILEEVPDCEIVITSTWRKNRSAQNLKDIFEENEFIGYEKIIDRTSVIEDATRGEEVQVWLDEHPAVESFVIIDDDNDMGHLSHRLVQTNEKIGLTIMDAQRAVDMLRGDKK